MSSFVDKKSIRLAITFLAIPNITDIGFCQDVRLLMAQQVGVGSKSFIATSAGKWFLLMLIIGYY